MYAFLTLYLWQVLDGLQCVDNLRWLEVADRVRSFLKIFTFSARATNYTKQPWQYPSWPSVLTSCSCLKVLSFEKLFHKPITKIDCQKFNSYKQGKKTCIIIVSNANRIKHFFLTWVYLWYNLALNLCEVFLLKVMWQCLHGTGTYKHT